MAEPERALILEVRGPTPARHQEMVMREVTHEALEMALIVATSGAGSSVPPHAEQGRRR